MVWLVTLFVLPLVVTQKHPVVIGYMASQLEADINKVNSPYWYCSREAKNVSLWFDPLNMVPYAFDCWQDNIRLHYDFKSRKTLDAFGVTVREVGFDDISSIRYSSRMSYPFTHIFSSFIDAMKVRGFKENVNLRAAPFDWRRAPYESSSWLAKFEDLVERTYSENNNSSVIILCHSYGCPFINHFFSRELEQPWKDKYIRSVVGVAGAWSGHFKSLYRYFGNEFDELLTLIFPGVVQVEKSFSSTAFLLPRPGTTWTDVPLVRTHNKNYTVDNLKDLVMEMHEPELLEKLKDAERAWGATFDPPGTDLHCITGKGFPTSHSIHFDIPKPGQTTYSSWKLIYGDGDGRIQSQSMNSCLLWKDQVTSSGKNFSYEELSFNHMDLIQHPKAIKHVIDLIQSL